MQLVGIIWYKLACKCIIYRFREPLGVSNLMAKLFQWLSLPYQSQFDQLRPVAWSGQFALARPSLPNYHTSGQNMTKRLSQKHLHLQVLLICKSRSTVKPVDVSQLLRAEVGTFTAADKPAGIQQGHDPQVPVRAARPCCLSPWSVENWAPAPHVHGRPRSKARRRCRSLA